MQSGNINNFSDLSQFKDIRDFNNSIEQWMLDIKKKFTKSELVALKRLIRFSAKVKGVCNAKIGTIVSATHEKDGAGISRSTFKRMIAKAKTIGLISVHNTVRKNGSKSSNLYVFSPFLGHAEPSKVKKLNQPQTSNLSKTTIKNNNKRKEKVEREVVNKSKLDSSFTNKNVPIEFTRFVSNFYNDAKEVEEYWKLVNISAYKNKVKGDVIGTAIDSFKILVRKIKLSKVHNTYGFFYGVLNKKLKAKYHLDLFKEWWEEY
ncbi:hypothetical protein VBD025_03955 [Virgibacillus flavescens]|uniref:hypothetical protein n=1 Tax=Virgibacillus flavescens TaxID=1611422 RepID=UPI003D32486B